MALSLFACTSRYPLQRSANKQSIGTTIIGPEIGAISEAGLANAPEQKASDIMILSATGATLGTEFDQYLDIQDRASIDVALYKAMEYTPSGIKTAWRNPDSGKRGYIKPLKTWTKASEKYCREYKLKIISEAKKQKAHSIICRRPDGTWGPISNSLKN